MRLGTERKNIKVHSSQSNFTVGPIHSELYLYCLQYKRKKLQSVSSKALFFWTLWGLQLASIQAWARLSSLQGATVASLLWKQHVSDNCSPAAATACCCLHPHLLPAFCPPCPQKYVQGQAQWNHCRHWISINKWCLWCRSLWWIFHIFTQQLKGMKTS